MKKRTVKNKRAARIEETFDEIYAVPARKIIEPLSPQTEKQKKYMAAIKSHTITFATGSAGTGKTYIAAAMAAQALENKQVEQIVVTRPAVEAGESLGFLPGNWMKSSIRICNPSALSLKNG